MERWESRLPEGARVDTPTNVTPGEETGGRVGEAANRRGAILLLAYLLVAALSAWLMAGFTRSSTELRAAERWVDTVQALYLAEGGIDDALVWLRTRPSPPSGMLRFNPFGGPRALGHGRYTAEIAPDPHNHTAYTYRFTLDTVGEHARSMARRRVQFLIQNESFSRYAYFTNLERMANGNPLWFTTRDHLTGPISTNDQLNISGNPIFDGPVSSAASSIRYFNGGPPRDNPAFSGGLGLNAPPTQLPLTVTPLRTAAAAGGLWLNGNTSITLQSNGTMLVTNPVRGWVNRPQSLPANGAIFVNGGNLTVEGTVKGQVTLGTSHNIIVANSVRYACDPLTDTACADLLGLVAEQNVVVSHLAPSDVTIQGAVMALHESFTVENWWIGPPKGTLSVLGGIIQTRRGPVGTFSGSTGGKLSGYTKNYRYDTRFSSMAPPFYPTTTQYQALMWQEGTP